MLKGLLGKTWREILRFCKPNLILCEDQLAFGIKRSLGTPSVPFYSTYKIHVGSNFIKFGQIYIKNIIILFVVHAMPTTLQSDHSEVHCALRGAEWHDRRQ